jgi:malate dehydrogenase
MTTVCILGAGELGGAVAHALARRHFVSRLTLVDDAQRVAVGKALDIQQSCAIERIHTQLDGTDDFTRVAGSTVVVFADRVSHISDDWSGDDAIALLGRLSPYLGEAPLVFAAASQGGVLSLAARELRLRRQRLVGSSAEAIASAARAMVALEARCSPVEVSLSVLGVPPALVVPWSEAAIGGRALDRVLTQAELTRVEAKVARLWPPGPFALALAAARVVEALVRSSRQAMHVLTVLNGEFGVRNRIGTVPAFLTTAGIAAVRLPALNTRERVQLETVLGA